MPEAGARNTWQNVRVFTGRTSAASSAASATRLCSSLPASRRLSEFRSEICSSSASPLGARPRDAALRLAGLVLWAVLAVQRVVLAANSTPEPIGIRAHDLVTNPFKYEGQVVVLDPLSFPFLSQGAVFSWQRGVEATGRTGLRFKRIWAEGEALYDVMAVDVGAASSDLRPIGQLVVVLPPFLPRGDQEHVQSSSSGPLPLDKLWAVKAQGVVDATNALGAPVQIPKVKICYTAGCEDQTGPQAVASTPTQKELPVIEPYDLVRDPYLHRGQKVVLDFTTASTVSTAGHRSLPDSGLGLRFAKMLDAQTGVYDVIGIDLERWRGGLRPVGQLAVLLPSDWRQRLACPPGVPDAGPICVTGARWVVEPAGPYSGVNAVGATVEVPSVRFVARSAEYETRQDDSSLSDIQQASSRRTSRWCDRRRVRPPAATRQRQARHVSRSRPRRARKISTRGSRGATRSMRGANGARSWCVKPMRRGTDLLAGVRQTQHHPKRWVVRMHEPLH